MPKPTHGPVGSGLKPYRTVHDAFEPLRQRSLAQELADPHSEPEPLFSTPRPEYDPKRKLAPTLTCNGGDQAHFSGLCQNTVRQMALLQGFSINHHFQGTKTNAREQIGNAWGPLVAKAFLFSCAATKEAFDRGLIGAEDHIDDLYETLEAKGIAFPSTQAAEGTASTPSAQPTSSMSKFRYIQNLRKTVRPKTRMIIFGQSKKEYGPPATPQRCRESERAAKRARFMEDLEEAQGLGEFVDLT